jgi:hypothetical protein
MGRAAFRLLRQSKEARCAVINLRASSPERQQKDGWPTIFSVWPGQRPGLATTDGAQTDHIDGDASDYRINHNSAAMTNARRGTPKRTPSTTPLNGWRPSLSVCVSTTTVGCRRSEISAGGRDSIRPGLRRSPADCFAGGEVNSGFFMSDDLTSEILSSDDTCVFLSKKAPRCCMSVILTLNGRG